MNTEVYIFDFGDKIKIGVSKDVKGRLRSIENMSGNKAVANFSVVADPMLEREMHRTLKQYRTIGEYFSLSFDEAKATLIELADNFPIKEKRTNGGYHQKIKMALAYKSMSEAALARELGTTPQAFSQRMKTDRFSKEELERIAAILGAAYVSIFEFPDGTKI